MVICSDKKQYTKQKQRKTDIESKLSIAFVSIPPAWSIESRSAARIATNSNIVKKNTALMKSLTSSNNLKEDFSFYWSFNLNLFENYLKISLCNEIASRIIDLHAIYPIMLGLFLFSFIIAIFRWEIKFFRSLKPPSI